MYPNFPNISFEEFIDMANSLFPQLKNENFPPEESLGHQTELVARYLFKQPKRIFPAIDEKYLASEKYKDDLFDNIHFIRTHNLNQELHSFFIELGYPEEHLEFILHMGKVFPRSGGRTEKQKWEGYYTPELRQKVRVKERLIFKMFPEFDI
jgi:hypothetical protein